MFIEYVTPSEIFSSAVKVECGWLFMDFKTGRVSLEGETIPEALHSAVSKRILNFAGGRHCARKALTSLAETSLECGFFVEEKRPRWPSGYVGSITHSGDFVLAAVAKTSTLKSIGVDSEKISDTPARMQKIARKISSPQETEFVQKTLSTEHALTLIFSAKESLFKCLYPVVKEFFWFEAAELIYVEPSTQAFKIRLTKNLGAVFKAGSEFSGRYQIDKTHLHTCIELPA